LLDRWTTRHVEASLTSDLGRWPASIDDPIVRGMLLRLHLLLTSLALVVDHRDGRPDVTGRSSVHWRIS
jgi:hypothetical protein